MVAWIIYLTFFFCLNVDNWDVKEENVTLMSKQNVWKVLKRKCTRTADGQIYIVIIIKKKIQGTRDKQGLHVLRFVDIRSCIYTCTASRQLVGGLIPLETASALFRHRAKFELDIDEDCLCVQVYTLQHIKPVWNKDVSWWPSH